MVNDENSNRESFDVLLGAFTPVNIKKNKNKSPVWNLAEKFKKVIKNNFFYN